MSLIKNRPIPLLEAGPERELMAFLLEKVKQTKGLTTALVQQAGVNAKWLKPDEPRNIPSKRLLRIVLYTMHHLGREECKERANNLIDYVFDHILPSFVNHLASHRKQRPPSIRRLYWRRYRRGKKTITQQIYSLWNIQQPSATFCMASATPAMPTFPSFSANLRRISSVGASYIKESPTMLLRNLRRISR